MRRAAAAFAAQLLFVVAGICAGAPVQGQDAPSGEPAAAGQLRDPDFGVRTRGFGLQRRVEMYQWRRTDGRYAGVWSDAPIASTGHDADHANPREFPIRTRYWIARRVTLDGRPVQEDVLKAFGRWRPFRPGFTALPGNLAATFQPEGDGLSSAENPLDPQIGDLRITWHELVLPRLAGRVVLENGVWVPKANGAAGNALAAPGAAAGDEARTGPGERTTRRLIEDWRIPALCAFAVLLFLLLVRRKRRR